MLVIRSKFLIKIVVYNLNFIRVLHEFLKFWTTFVFLIILSRKLITMVEWPRLYKDNKIPVN